jgi:hypothetical protein
MTEQEKLAVYIGQTLQIDAADPFYAQRVHDITGAWMMRANEPPPLATGWRQTVAHVMQRLDLGEPENPTQATSAINASLDTLMQAISQANQMVQTLATRDAIIKQQSNILDAFAAVLQLEQGRLYMDMVPMLQSMKNAMEGKPEPMPPFPPT